MAARIVYGYGLSGITALKFDAPINEEIVDPTTVEGFRSCIGDIQVYEKPKNFKNTFVNYNIASVDTYEDYKNVFYVNSGSTDSNLTSANDYYICDGDNWAEKYAVSGKTVRYPYPTDLEQKIVDGFPVKFHFTQYDKNENGFWNSLYNTMNNVEIKDTYWASDLFTDSNVPKMNLTFNPQVKTENGTTVVASTNAVLDSCFENCTDLQSVKLTRKGDTNRFNTLKNVFKGCSSLSALTFDSVDSNGDASNAKWNVGQLSNTFNGCQKLTSWPNNIVISGTEFDETYANDTVVEMDYAFEGAGFQTIGSAEEFKVGKAEHAFNISSAVTINSVMDMRYVHPDVQNQVDTMFGTHKIETISLKNINHNEWNFDGVSTNRDSEYIGDCSLFNQASVEYLFHNLYDLTSNNLEANILQRKPTIPLFNQWITGGTGVVVNGNQVTFNDANGTLSVSNANDTFFKFLVSNMSTGDKITVDGGLNSLEITENGTYYVNVTASTCTITANNVSSSIVIDYITNWNGAVSDVTASTLYCPAEWDNSNNNRVIDDEMVTIATNRGWMVKVNDVLHTVRVEVVLDENSLTVGNTTTASVYFVRTRGQQETRTEITNNTGITYYSTDSNVASVDSNGTVTANGNGTAYIYVTFSGLTSSIVDNNAKEEVTSTEYWQLLLTPATASVSETNTTAQITATYRHYLNGTTTDTDVTHDTGTTWTVTGDGASYITFSEGLVTWTGNPSTDVTVTISASYSGTSSTSNPVVTVVHTVSEEYRLVLSPNSDTIYYINNTAEYEAQYQYLREGTLINSTNVTSAATWAVSGNASDYTTINQGVVTKTGATSTVQTGTISAIFSGVSAYNNPDITIRYDTTYDLELTINKASINVGETAQCTTRLYEYHDGIQTTYTGKTYDSDYSSDDTSIATVTTGQWSSNGKITGIGGGTAHITAEYGGYTATGSIIVNNVEEYRLVINPSTGGTLTQNGDTIQFEAIYQYLVNGNIVSSTDVTHDTGTTWTVNGSADDYVTINDGEVTKVDNPASDVTGTISATYDNTSSINTPLITVEYYNTTTYDLVISASPKTIYVNETGECTAYYVIEEGGVETVIPVDNTAVTWYISQYDANLISVDSDGIYTGLKQGYAFVHGSYSGLSSYASVNISNKVEYEVHVTVTPPSVQVGQTGQCTAQYVRYVNGVQSGSTTAITTNAGTTWSADTSVVNISNSSSTKGRFTGLTVDTTDVYCTYNGITGQATISVESAPVYVTGITVEITDVPTMPASGGTITSGHSEVVYVITAYYSNGTSQDITNNNSVVKSGNTVTAASLGSGVTSQELACTPDLMIEAEYEGCYGYSARTIYQEINSIEGTVVDDTRIEDGTETTSTEYHISGTNLTITDLAQTGGTESNAVSGYSITTHTIPQTEITIWETTYTSGAKSYSETSQPISARTVVDNPVAEDVDIDYNPNWVTNVTTGTSGQFSYSQNTDAERSDSIIYSLHNSPSDTWTTEITQDGYYTIEVTPNSLTDVDYNGDAYTVSVTAVNQTWTISGKPNWVTVNPDNGNAGTTNITVTIAANTGYTSRDVTITFEGSINGSDTLYIEQEALPQPVVVTGIVLTIGTIQQPVVSAAGSPSSVNYNYLVDNNKISVEGYFSNGTHRTLDSSEYGLASNSLSFSNRGRNTGSTISQTLTVTATTTINNVGITDSDSCTIEQQENVLSASSTPGNWEEEFVSSGISHEYQIIVENDTISDLEYTAGSVGNNAYGIDSATTATTYQSARTVTYTSAWTSGEYDTTGITEYGNTRTATSTQTSVANVNVKSGYDTNFITNVTTGQTTGRISYSQNESYNSRNTTITYELVADNSKTDTTTISQKAHAITLDRIEVIVSGGPTVAASGGEVAYSGYTSGGEFSDDAPDYAVYAYYSNAPQTAVDITNEPETSIYSNIVTFSNRGTTTGTPLTDILTVAASYNGKTDSGSTNVYQEANEIILVSADTQNVNVGTSAWTVDGTVYYTIEVTPSATTVSSGSGTFNIDVSASATTPYTAYTCNTWQVETTPWTAYTAEPWEHYGTSTTGSTQHDTPQQTGTNENVVTASTSNQSKPAWVTSATNSSVDYEANPNTSSRSGDIVYQVNAHSSTTGSCTVTQEEKMQRKVTINFVDDWSVHNTSINAINNTLTASIGQSSPEFSDNVVLSVGDNTLAFAGNEVELYVDITTTGIPLSVIFSVTNQTYTYQMTPRTGWGNYGTYETHVFDGGIASFQMNIAITPGTNDIDVYVYAVSWEMNDYAS